MRFTGIEIKGYRSLVDVSSLSLRPLAAMIGPNGSGKTALLEIFLLLRSAAQEKLAEALGGLGGLDAVLSKTLEAPDRLGISLTVDVESERGQGPMDYCFELLPRGVSYAISFERLEWQLDPTADTLHRYIDAHYDNVCWLFGISRGRCDGSPNLFGFAASHPQQVGASKPSPCEILKTLYVIWGWAGLNFNSPDTMLSNWYWRRVHGCTKEPEGLRNALSKTQHYSFLDASQRAMVRLPQSLTPAMRPGPNGENLYSALYNLRALHQDVYMRIEDTLRVGFPGFERLEFPVVGAGQVTLVWYQKDLKSPLYPNQLSEGTLRFLWLATILLVPDPPPIILLDKPEVSLHPELIKLLAGLLQDASTRGQIIAATHSPDLMRWLQPQEVLVLDKIDGRTQFTWADELDLEEWLEEYTLRDLWLMGTLGGRP